MGHEFVRRGRRTRAPHTRVAAQREPRWWRCRCCGREAGSTGSAFRPPPPAPTPSRSWSRSRSAVAVPNGLPPQLATLTEPMAVAWHAVRRGEVKKRTVAVVIGCGPIGLSVICMLKASRGADRRSRATSRPAAATLARACGADVVVDPALESPYALGRAARPPHDASRRPSTPHVGAMEKLQRLPLPWHRVWRAAEALRRDHPEEPGDLRMRRRSRA